MSNNLLTRAWNARGLSPTEKIILVRLADRADNNGHCFPGHESLADDCGLSTRTIRDTLPIIETKGHLTIKEHGHRTAKGSSRFTYVVHPVTSEATSGVAPENAAFHPGKEVLRQGKSTLLTPEKGAPPILTSTNLVPM